MYTYNDFDKSFIATRNSQFRDQVERRIDGSLTEDEFKPLRLMNGLYLQLHAYMLRVAIPYGTLNGGQMRQLAFIADKWDKGYGHFTTRQNIQYNWPELRDVPDMLDALAEVGMHAIQTSGNTIRNVTADHFAGAAADEIADPRPVAELIRQWSTDHPEFQFLPRKFKYNAACVRQFVIVVHVLFNHFGHGSLFSPRHAVVIESDFECILKGRVRHGKLETKESNWRAQLERQAIISFSIQPRST